ncbi:MAG: hypothetical protein HY869_03295 [Chloroflexi bacterium]|nr:hypothetical protein [Chloroflexota bacterium]
MEKKNEQDGKKKIATVVIVVVIIAALFWVASVLVANFNIAEFLKQLHGG